MSDEAGTPLSEHSDSLLAPLPTGTEMREWERGCFAAGTLDQRVAMESAGRAAAAAVAGFFPDGPVGAAIGRGNNGGDAVVALRTLRAAGREVFATLVEGARIPAVLTHGWELPVRPLTADAFTEASVVIDGVLGTGATGAPRDPEAGLIRAMNASGRPIVALDGPSGVDLTTGAAEGEAVRASLTITFGALKTGLVLHPGRQLAGRILVAEIGLPPSLPAAAAVITERWAHSRLPPVAPDAHKGSTGWVGVFAGNAGFAGAAVLAAMGALRAGCGGVRVFSRETNRVAVNAAVPEAVFLPIDDPIDLSTFSSVSSALVGPGIGTDASAATLLRTLLDSGSMSTVIDADALTLIARDPGLLPAAVAARCVLTPHPGELGRLLGVPTEVVVASRFDCAREAAERFGCAILSKGAPNLVAAPGRAVLVALSGHSGVATGGMGDTLGGVVAAFLAAGAAPRAAAAIAAHYAGRAAEAAGRGRGLLPRDVAEALPEVIRRTPGRAPLPPPLTLDLPPAT